METGDAGEKRTESFLVDRVPVRRLAVALTFDDGPDPAYTPEIADILRRNGGRATFFVIGQELERSADIARMLHVEGHELGNHTQTHASLTALTEAERRAELESADRLLEALTGRRPRLFRPPYLAIDAETARTGAAMGYRAVGAANLEAEDWRMPGTAHILEHTRSEVRPGSILIFHDGLGDRSQTVEAVSVLVPELRKQGYELVTVSRLLEMAEQGL
ncbi:polysaccharide deacetylase family protein [Paenibacillus glufosinatiresistens]|uniref:polysaccharide deacetylase family protein n=1 Tax=Paenibacillus glufosinatiresistens TaxID=3070657 RepID=UPI00286E50A0|nr:polysaccharide deacetylase family protein [Paenibacillus sp. YX.27]